MSNKQENFLKKTSQKKAAFFAPKQQMGIAALIMGLSILISRFMGLFRDKIISWQFGASGETDLYFTAFVLPDFLNYLLAGGYISITLIPILSRLFSHSEDEEGDDQNSLAQKDAWQFFGSVFTWAVFSISFLSLIAWIFAPRIAYFLAPGFSDEQLERLVYFLRIILPAQVCFLAGACFCALLYVRKQFWVPALVPLIYNGFILGCGVLFPYIGLAYGMDGFCYGVLIGAFLGSFLLPYFAVKSGGLVWHFSFYHPQLKNFVFLALPLMLGQSIVVMDEQFIRIFGSLAGDGAVSLLSYARRIMMVPVGVVAQAAGLASFPFLASLLAKGDTLGFSQTLSSSLKNTVIVALPITFFMVAVAHLTLGFLFEGGQFTSYDTLRASPLLQIMLFSVPFWVLQQIIGRAFYAMENTLTPAIIGTLITICALPFYAVFSYNAFGIACITSACVVFYSFCLIIVARMRYHDIFMQAFKGLFLVFFKNILLCLLPFCFIIVSLPFLEKWLLLYKFSLLFNQFAQLSLSGFLFGILYIIFSKIFLPENIVLLYAPFKRRLQKRGEK